MLVALRPFLVGASERSAKPTPNQFDPSESVGERERERRPFPANHSSARVQWRSAPTRFLNREASGPCLTVRRYRIAVLVRACSRRCHSTTPARPRTTVRLRPRAARTPHSRARSSRARPATNSPSSRRCISSTLKPCTQRCRVSSLARGGISSPPARTPSCTAIATWRCRSGASPTRARHRAPHRPVPRPGRDRYDRRQAAYRLKYPFRDGTIHVVLDPIEFIRHIRVPHPYGTASGCANRQSCRFGNRRVTLPALTRRRSGSGVHRRGGRIACGQRARRRRWRRRDPRPAPPTSVRRLGSGDP